MEKSRFKKIRARLEKTQKEMAQLLGISVKAIHSYEQGWRNIPPHVERQLLFLFSRSVVNNGKETDKCWDLVNCPDERIENCPAWEFQAGDLCWFISGTRCNGKIHSSWEDKMAECRACTVFKKIFDI
ncbi:MAG: helix-turn-helix transcriptional regulator [Desulfobacteraceae bacterium]